MLSIIFRYTEINKNYLFFVMFSSESFSDTNVAKSLRIVL